MGIPTVKIVHEDGYAVINETDFDAELHEVFDDDAEGADGADVDPAPVDRAQMENDAKELGVSFRKNTSDEVLAERVAEALGG